MQTNVWKQWKFLQNFPLLILTPMQSCREICCKVMSVNSSNFPKTRNYPNCAATLVWRILKKDNSSSHWWRRRTKWNEESMSRVFIASKRRSISSEKGGFSETRKSAQSLDVKVCLHQRRYGIEIMIESLLREGTASSVRIVNGINKYVTETSQTISLENVEHRVTGKPVAKAKPRLKLAVTPSPISIPFRERKWMDINPERFRQDCFAVSKSHDQITATWSIDDILKEFKGKFDGASQWLLNDGMSILAKRGGLALLVFPSNSGTFRR